jgi:hypothetical protein
MSQAVISNREATTIRSLISEVQTDICKSHECMARLWLMSTPGLMWIEGVEEQRYVSNCIVLLLHIGCANFQYRTRGKRVQWVTADQLMDSFFCDLSPAELASLWCSVSDAVSSVHWENPDDPVYQSLRHDSFELIAKMVNGLHVGVAAHRTTNVQARLRMLQSITRIDHSVPWPGLPMGELLYPPTAEGWTAYREHYPVCHENINFARLFQYCGVEGKDLFYVIAGQRLDEVLNVEHHGQSDSVDPNLNGTSDDPPGSANGNVADGGDPSPGGDTNIFNTGKGIPLHDRHSSAPPQPHRTELVEDTGKIVPDTGKQTGHSPEAMHESNTDSERGQMFFGADGNLMSGGMYDDDDEPAESELMYLGPEEQRVDQNRIELIAQFLAVDKADDMRAITRFVQQLNPPTEFLCQRGFDLARLGGDGLFRYCMDLLQTNAIVYEQLTEYFAHRQAGCIERSRTLATAIEGIHEKFAQLERQTSSFRVDSTQRTVDQQQLNSSRRQLNRLQAQANSQRLGFIRSGDSGSMLSSLPPLAVSRSRPASTAPGKLAHPDDQHLSSLPGHTHGDTSSSSLGSRFGSGVFGDSGFDEAKFGE